VVADGQRAEVPGVALAWRPAGDDQFLLGPGLELQPGLRSPARLVPAPPQLGDHAFEVVGRRRLEERLAVADDVGRETHARVWPEHALEQSLAILERDIEQRTTIEIEQVERLVDKAADALLAELCLEER